MLRSHPMAGLAVAACLIVAGVPVPAAAAPSTPASPAATSQNVKYLTVREVGGRPEYLWEIAQRVLGDAARDTEILELNRGRVEPDGDIVTDPDVLHTGWVLVLPWDAVGEGVTIGPLPAIRPVRPAPTASATTVPPAAATETICTIPPKRTVAGLPWAQLRLTPETAWTRGTGSGITVAVIDSGVDATVAALAGRVLPGADTTITAATPKKSSKTGKTGKSGTRTAKTTTGTVAQPAAAAPLSATAGTAAQVALPAATSLKSARPTASGGKTAQSSGAGRADRDCLGRGTGMAGIIAAAKRDGSDFTGVAPDATILPIKIATSGGVAHPGQVVAALKLAAAGGARVAMIGATVDTGDAAIVAALESAVAAGLLVVLAAPPDWAGDVPQPPSGVIRVGAVNPDEKLAESYRQGTVDVVAPGIDVVTLGPGGVGEVEGSGAGYAVAFVAGTAALVLSAEPGRTPASAAARITGTAEGAGPGTARDSWYGWGMINPAAAVDAPPAGARSSFYVGSPLGLGAVLLLAIFAAVMIAAGLRRRATPPPPPRNGRCTPTILWTCAHPPTPTSQDRGGGGGEVGASPPLRGHGCWAGGRRLRRPRLRRSGPRAADFWTCRSNSGAAQSAA